MSRALAFVALVAGVAVACYNAAPYEPIPCKPTKITIDPTKPTDTVRIPLKVCGRPKGM